MGKRSNFGKNVILYILVKGERVKVEFDQEENGLLLLLVACLLKSNTTFLSLSKKTVKVVLLVSCGLRQEELEIYIQQSIHSVGISCQFGEYFL